MPFLFTEQKCTKRWKSLRDKFAREMKLCQESRWRYFKQMQFLVDSIRQSLITVAIIKKCRNIFCFVFRQYRESLLGKCGATPQVTNQVAQVDAIATQQQQQQPQQQQTVVDIFPFNGSAASTSAQALSHPHGQYKRKVNL